MRLHRRHNGFWAAVAHQPSAEDKEKITKYINADGWSSALEKQRAIEELGKSREELRYHAMILSLKFINFFHLSFINTLTSLPRNQCTKTVIILRVYHHLIISLLICA